MAPGARLTRIVAGVLAGTALIAGGIATAAALWPNQVEQLYGAAHAAIAAAPQQFTSTFTGTPLPPPAVTLGRPGGIRQLDACDGTFTLMVDYAAATRPPVWAEHNHCGGDVLLPWRVGQRVRLTGGAAVSADGLYEVVEIRYLPKNGGLLSGLDGMQGTVALQSCYYGVNRMKFVGLVRVR